MSMCEGRVMLGVVDKEACGQRERVSSLCVREGMG